MTTMKLFKLLQAHVGTLNKLAVDVSEEKIPANEAQVTATVELEKTLAELKKEG